MLRKCFPDIIHDTRGNVIGLACIGLVSLVGGAGLGVDTIQWYLWKAQLQQGVEAGALGGAYALSLGQSVTPAAEREVNRSNDLDLTIEAINSPPASGEFADETDAVEVIATASRALPFSSLFIETPTVRARAVAKGIGIGDYCMVSLAPTGTGIDLGGNADVELNCGAASNSSAANSFALSPNTTLSANPIFSAGGISGASNLAPDTTQLLYGNPLPDPFTARNLAVPATPAACTRSHFSVNSNQTVNITPGRYCNGMTIRGTLNMAPGVYIVDRGTFDAGAQARVTGTGVTIVLTGSDRNNIANINVNGGARLDISPPDESQDSYWQEILFFQDPRGSSRSSSLNGGGSFDLEGIIYMPLGDLQYSGNNSTAAQCVFLVAYRISLTGTAGFENDCPEEYEDSKPRVQRVRIVE